MTVPMSPVSPIIPVGPISPIGMGPGPIVPVNPPGASPGPIVGGGLGNGGIGGIQPVTGPVTGGIGIFGGGVLKTGAGSRSPVGTGRMGASGKAGGSFGGRASVQYPTAGGISASAQLSLVSTTGNAANPTFHYRMTLTDTGTTTVGSFWFAWDPSEADFLPTTPLSEGSPAGWRATVTGPISASDGTAIEWVAQSPGAFLQPGESVTGFDFTSHDTLAQLAGNSPHHPGNPTMTSFVYMTGPELDPGFQFVVSEAPTTPQKTGTSTTLRSSGSPAQTGTEVTFTAQVTPASGSTAPTGNVVFSENGNPIGVGALQADGTATFTTHALAAGQHILVATYGGDDNFTGSNSGQFNETITTPVVSGAATHLAFAQQPPLTVIAGHALAPMVVNLLNASGQIDTTNNSNVTIVISNGATLRGTLTVAAVHGVATFTGLSATKAGSFTLGATDGTLAAAHSRALTVSADAASAQLVLVSRPAASVVVGKALAPAVVVREQDQFGNVITSDHSKVTASVASGPGRIAGNVTATLNNGSAMLTGLSLTTAGNDTLQVTDTSLAVKTPVKFNETVTRGTSSVQVISATGQAHQSIVTAAIHSNAPATVPFTGTATLVESGGQALGSSAVSANGGVRFTLNGLATGTHMVTIHYAGDVNHEATVSAAFALHVNAAVVMKMA